MTIISILVKATLLVGLAVAAQALLARRSSAATRHLIWSLAVAGLLLLPVLAATLPGWTAVRVTAPANLVARTIVESPSRMAGGPLPDESVPVVVNGSPASPSSSPWNRRLDLARALTAFYAAGIVFLLGRALHARGSMHRLMRHAAPITDPSWTALLTECRDALGLERPVRLLRSAEQTMPMMAGIRKPAIVIPVSADGWSDDRRRAVLLHELAHVARHDCLTQTLASAASALYWVHPGVWWIARRLRIERELACDDRVLSAGANAGDYAGHLLEIAYAFGRGAAPALAVTMARSQQLEGRLLAVLDAARNRATPALRSRIAGLVVLAAVLIPVAAATTVIVSSRTSDTEATQPAEDPDQNATGTAAQSKAAEPSELLPGTWEIRPSEEAGRVYLQLREGDGFHGSTIDVDRLSGLTATPLTGTGRVQFSITREAGTFTFEGVAKRGVAAGTFDFVPNAAFSEELVRRGFARPTPAQQRLLARRDVGVSFIDELNRQGYTRPDLAGLVRATDHAVTLPYLREMGQLGYRVGQLDRLVELRDHDVTPRFISGLAAQGLKGLPADEVVRARSHDVTPEYVSALASHGYGPFDLDTLIDLRSHDVSAGFLDGLSSLGYPRLPTDAVLRLRSHDVMPSYIRELQALGHKGLSVDDLLTLRSHDVQPRYVKALQALGYRSLGVEDLVDLRSHDVQPEEVRLANSRAGRQLTVDRLTELASRGWR